MANDTMVTVIGAGMAGSEAAWQAAERGAKVRLIEMRPIKMSPAHRTDRAAEIVCSNSFKSNRLSNASGLLKEEMRRLGSLIVRCADETAVPAGEALAVDRDAFCEAVTHALENHPNIEFVRDEAVDIPPEGPVIIASGPLTSDTLAAKIGELTGRYDLYFYDAVAPIVDASTIDFDKVFRASRYGKSSEADGSGEDDAAYLNCPFEKDDYLAFHQALLDAEKAPMHDFEDVKYFESCLPVEELAARGPKTLAFGPLKPVGLTDPKTGCRPYAVVQLRQENHAATLYNLVGFQTRLKWGDQKRVLRMIPGLENAEFVRFGVMHRNTYIHSPSLLTTSLQMREHPRIFFAGQIVGVEGYLESASTGTIAGINAARFLKGEEPLVFPETTVLGSLVRYVSEYEGKTFAPMNSCWGLLPPLDGARERDKRERGRKMGERGLAAFDDFARRELPNHAGAAR